MCCLLNSIGLVKQKLDPIYYGSPTSMISFLVIEITAEFRSGQRRMQHFGDEF